MSSSPSGFATRISSPTFSPSIRLRVPLSSPRVVSALVALDVAVSLLSSPLSVVTSSPPRHTVPEFSLLVPWFLPNCHPFRVHAYTSLPSVVKSNPRDLSSPPRCSVYLGYSFPCLFTNRLFPFPHLGAHVGETTSTKCKEKRGTTDERNRGDLRPASEKAIWANRTPVGRERSSG